MKEMGRLVFTTPREAWAATTRDRYGSGSLSRSLRLVTRSGSGSRSASCGAAGTLSCSTTRYSSRPRFQTWGHTGFDAGLDQWTIAGPSNGTVTPIDAGGFTAALLDSQTGQPVGVEQVFDGYGVNAASASVSIASGLSAQITLDILRLDGSEVDSCTSTIDGLAGTVTTCSVYWPLDTEDLLVYRITSTGSTTGLAGVYVEDVFVGLSL